MAGDKNRHVAWSNISYESIAAKHEPEILSGVLYNELGLHYHSFTTEGEKKNIQEEVEHLSLTFKILSLPLGSVLRVGVDPIQLCVRVFNQL